MKRIIYLLLFLLLTGNIFAQKNNFRIIKNNPSTTVKDQFKSGTCWDFACTAMIESELLKTTNSQFDLSETFTVFNTYIDKAAKYISCRGRTCFNKGGIGEDMLYIIDNYGAMPQSVYPGIDSDTIMNREDAMYPCLKSYLDSIIKNHRTVPSHWKDDYVKILNHYIGTPCKSFFYKGKYYTSKTFASNYIKNKSSDFIGLTSFTNHAYYTSFVIDLPHNYNKNVYKNLPLYQLIKTVKGCIENGYTLIWDTDITNAGFEKNKGFAMWATSKSDSMALPYFREKQYTSKIRQQLFNKGITRDDHLMLITGLAKNASGEEYFVVKNSWGKCGPFNGYLYVSIPYFAINTVSVLVNKKALPKAIMDKLAGKNKLHQMRPSNDVIVAGK